MAGTGLQKNQIVRLTCERLGADLEGVCRFDGQAVFVPDVLPGETFDARVLKTQKTYAYAKSETLISPLSRTAHAVLRRVQALRRLQRPAYDLCANPGFQTAAGI